MYMYKAENRIQTLWRLFLVNVIVRCIQLQDGELG